MATPSPGPGGAFAPGNVANGSSVKDTVSYQKSLVAASLYVDYVFLDTDERRRMAQNPHEYLIEQLQFTGDESVGSSSNKIKLNFNHPCKELVFVVQPDANVDYCSSFLKNTNLNMALGAQPFNYTDALDALVPSIAAFAGYDTVAGNHNNISYNAQFIQASTGMFQDPGADTLPMGSAVGQSEYGNASCSVPAMSVPFPISPIGDSGVSDAGAFVLGELPSTFTAGDRTPWLLLNSSSTDRIASQNVKELTSTSCSHTSTTPVRQTLVSTFTRSLFAQRSTSQVALATCPVLITLPSSLSFPPTPLAETTRLRSAFTLPTTMCSVL